MFLFFCGTAMHGFHVYKGFWEPIVGEVLVCERKISNSHDTFAVIIRNSTEMGCL